MQKTNLIIKQNEEILETQQTQHTNNKKIPYIVYNQKWHQNTKFQYTNLEQSTTNSNKRIQRQLSTSPTIYKVAIYSTMNQFFWVFQFWGSLVFTNKIRNKNRFD